MLEGNEVEGKIGRIGNYFLNVKDNGDIELGVSAKANLVDELRGFAAKNNIKWLTNVADFIGNMLPKPAPQVEEPKA